MGRTNVVVDDELIAKVMRLYGLRSKREAIDFALRRVAGEGDPYELALQLEGVGWDGDLDAMRDSERIEEF
jgi:Arc/MetJ family transcription regulator